MLYDSVEYTIQQQQSINMIDRIASSWPSNIRNHFNVIIILSGQIPIATRVSKHYDVREFRNSCKQEQANTQRRLWSHISASSHQPCSAISCLYTAKVSEKNFSLRYCDLDKGGVSTIIFCRASICYILLSLFLNQ